MATRGRPRKTEEEKEQRKKQLAEMEPIERLENTARHFALHKVNSETTKIAEDEDDNARFLRNAIEIMNLPEIDLDNFQQVKNRISEYFQILSRNRMKAGVVGLANALGIDRFTLYAIVENEAIKRNGKSYRIAQECRNCIKKAFEIIQQQWEDNMQNGKINPASGIFLGKNHFHYTDVQEHVLSTEEPKQDYSPIDIGQRYLSADAPANPPLDDPDGSVT